MKKGAGVIDGDGIVQVIVVEVDENGETIGMRDHPLRDRLHVAGGVSIGMVRSADGQFRRPVDPGRPDEPGAP